MIGGFYELIIYIPIQSGYHSKTKLQEGKEEFNRIINTKYKLMRGAEEKEGKLSNREQ